MFLRSIILLFLSSIGDINGSNDRCAVTNLGYEYANRTGHCYKFHTQAYCWTSAKLVCAEEGARLAVINSDAEARVLMEVFEQNPPAVIEGPYGEFKNYVMVGVYLESGRWRTVDGQTLDQAGYSKWVRGRPTNESELAYGFMSRQGILNQGTNNYRYAFICEKTL